VFFYYEAKLKGKIKIENMASPRRLLFFLITVSIVENI
jgi:hypothetical protein